VASKPVRGKGSRSANSSRKGAGTAKGLADKFFEEGEEAAPAETEALDPSVYQGYPIVSPEKRRSFLRWVGITLGLCTVLCVAALATKALRQDSVVAHDAKAGPLVEPVLNAPAPAPVASAAIPPPPAESAAPVASAEAASAVTTKSAAEEKDDARKSLERGRTQDAIDAATRSTALDPTDADAWLLLGAAYMERGKAADARAAFASCAKGATKGPVRECQAMLR
jgi:tetratricopeptide (TPR) repeat protein